MNLTFPRRLFLLGLIGALLSSRIDNVLAHQQPVEVAAPLAAHPHQNPLNVENGLVYSPDGQSQKPASEDFSDSHLDWALSQTSAPSIPLTLPSSQSQNILHTITSRLAQYILGHSPKSTSRFQFHNDKDLSRAESILISAAELDNPDAIYRLAELNFWGNLSHTRNYTTAFRYYNQLARLTGNATAQFMVGFMHATSIGLPGPTNQALALLHYTFAADGGDVRAQMALGHRYHNGISCSRSCEDALRYYRLAATQVMERAKDSPLGGPRWSSLAFSLAEESGGLYGEIASTSTGGMSKNPHFLNFNSRRGLDDMMEYLDLLSQSGDIKAILALGKLYYEGSKTLKPNLEAASMYFMNIGQRFWTKSGKKKEKLTTFANSIASESAGYLGMMFMRGEGFEQSYSEAFTWLERGVAGGDPRSQYGLGLLHLTGNGTPKNPTLAAEFLGNASDLDFAPAQVEMGRLFLDQGEPITALRYFDLAARGGNLEAFYYLAEMIRQGIGRDQNCAVATMYYKIVTEKAEMMTASFDEAETAYLANDLDGVLIRQLMAAEQGFEVAQANVGYLLDPMESKWSLLSLLKSLLRLLRIQIPKVPEMFQFYSKLSDGLNLPGLSAIYYTRAAKQSNIDAMVKMGDLYLTDLSNFAPLTEFRSDPEKAAAWYSAATETLQCAQAMWNLGWMHENGIGMSQSFHLAKRMYDQALATNKRANVPIKLALWKLRIRAHLNNLLGMSTEDSTLPRWDTDESSKPKTFTEWMARFRSNAATVQETLQAQGEEDGDGVNPLGGDGWGFESDGPPVALGSREGDYIEESEEGVFESLAIFMLSAALIFLLVWRQQRMERRRRQEEGEERRRLQQQQQQQLQPAQPGPGHAPTAPQPNDRAGGNDQRAIPDPINPNNIDFM